MWTVWSPLTIVFAIKSEKILSDIQNFSDFKMAPVSTDLSLGSLTSQPSSMNYGNSLIPNIFYEPWKPARNNWIHRRKLYFSNTFFKTKCHRHLNSAKSKCQNLKNQRFMGVKLLVWAASNQFFWGFSALCFSKIIMPDIRYKVHFT